MSLHTSHWTNKPRNSSSASPGLWKLPTFGNLRQSVSVRRLFNAGNGSTSWAKTSVRQGPSTSALTSFLEKTTGGQGILTSCNPGSGYAFPGTLRLGYMRSNGTE
ncbi:hypothetical protein F5887DRAFT_917098 [Amanita rubescens]|nr:hypothetical protein F5887DRAFT_917098 [Amanita rubescens]